MKSRAVGILAATDLLLGLACGPSAVAETTTSYTGQLLVAAPDMPDPRFAETVIYICRHDVAGAFGVVLNRRLGEMPLAKLFESFGLDRAQEAKGAIEVRRGGPVEVTSGYVLHTDDVSAATTVCRGDGVAISGGTDVVQALGEGRGPERAVLFLGYSGWGPGQLDDEMAHGGWDVVPADRETLFDSKLDSLWRRARERRGLDL